ncbi:anther-specific proline-rich protein APG-like [Vitis vinifera]|uniref:anther-specific proline-rich protein APG-like n=1 Tax=Vitis vinifera TaxID=29760 RepID=UPI00053FEAC5|nr:anther-specific proline-rich protein APG-like [Vitis vinifera]|eukprot:XP_010651711.1 PREDICTED: anther-specific proline-rich protein APG-like [Vitis vinifera]
MARTRGAKSSSPSNRKKSLRKEPVPDPAPQPSQPKAIPPPMKPAPPKPPAKRYLTRSGGRPLQKKPRVESSEVPSPVPQAKSPAPQAKAQEPQAPLPEPQIAAEVAPKEVIRRPMLPQPPIEGNLDCRTRPFHSELCFDLPAFRVRLELAQSFQLLRRTREQENMRAMPEDE